MSIKLLFLTLISICSNIFCAEKTSEEEKRIAAESRKATTLLRRANNQFSKKIEKAWLKHRAFLIAYVAPFSALTTILLSPLWIRFFNLGPDAKRQKIPLVEQQNENYLASMINNSLGFDLGLRYTQLIIDEANAIKLGVAKELDSTVPRKICDYCLEKAWVDVICQSNVFPDLSDKCLARLYEKKSASFMSVLNEVFDLVREFMLGHDINRDGLKKIEQGFAGLCVESLLKSFEMFNFEEIARITNICKKIDRDKFEPKYGLIYRQALGGIPHPEHISLAESLRDALKSIIEKIDAEKFEICYVLNKDKQGLSKVAIFPNTEPPSIFNCNIACAGHQKEELPIDHSAPSPFLSDSILASPEEISFDRDRESGALLKKCDEQTSQSLVQQQLASFSMVQRDMHAKAIAVVKKSKSSQVYTESKKLFEDQDIKNYLPLLFTHLLAVEIVYKNIEELVEQGIYNLDQDWFIYELKNKCFRDAEAEKKLALQNKDLIRYKYLSYLISAMIGTKSL